MTEVLLLSLLYTKIFLECPRGPLQIAVAKSEVSSVKFSKLRPKSDAHLHINTIRPTDGYISGCEGAYRV